VWILTWYLFFSMDWFTGSLGAALAASVVVLLGGGLVNSIAGQLGSWQLG
jgi:hypothetical protein